MPLDQRLEQLAGLLLNINGDIPNFVLIANNILKRNARDDLLRLKAKLQQLRAESARAIVLIDALLG